MMKNKKQQEKLFPGTMCMSPLFSGLQPITHSLDSSDDDDYDDAVDDDDDNFFHSQMQFLQFLGK